MYEEASQKSNSFSVFAIFRESSNDSSRSELSDDDNKGIEHSSDERESHHITVQNMSHLMANYSLHFIIRHSIEESGRDSDECLILTRASSKCIRIRRVVYSNLGHIDTFRLYYASDGSIDTTEPWILYGPINELDLIDPLRLDTREQKR